MGRKYIEAPGPKGKAAEPQVAECIDMSLHVVGGLLGREVVERTARQMEYQWSGEP